MYNMCEFKITSLTIIIIICENVSVCLCVVNIAVKCTGTATDTSQKPHAVTTSHVSSRVIGTNVLLCSSGHMTWTGDFRRLGCFSSEEREENSVLF